MVIYGGPKKVSSMRILTVERSAQLVVSVLFILATVCYLVKTVKIRPTLLNDVECYE